MRGLRRYVPSTRVKTILTSVLSDSCLDFDYCSACRTITPPPLRHPNSISGRHTVEHRFLVIKRDCPPRVADAVAYTLRGKPVADGVEVAPLSPLIVHCLSEPEESVSSVAKALADYRKRCLDANTNEDIELGPGLLSLPSAAEFARSQSIRWLQMKEAQEENKRPTQ